MIIVVAGGSGVIVDPETGEAAGRIAMQVCSVQPLPDLQVLLFSNHLWFDALGPDGWRWQSPRISWDEMQNIVIDGNVLHGEASTPTAEGHVWVPFTLDLLTGRCLDGIYEEQMRGAIRIVPEGRDDNS